MLWGKSIFFLAVVYKAADVENHRRYTEQGETAGMRRWPLGLPIDVLKRLSGQWKLYRLGQCPSSDTKGILS